MPLGILVTVIEKQGSSYRPHGRRYDGLSPQLSFTAQSTLRITKERSHACFQSTYWTVHSFSRFHRAQALSQRLLVPTTHASLVSSPTCDICTRGGYPYTGITLFLVYEQNLIPTLPIYHWNPSPNLPLPRWNYP